MARKFVIYLEGVSRGIVITDDDESIPTDILSQKLTEKMLGYEMCEFKTSTDCLIVRPSQITGVHIQGNNFNHTTNKDKTKVNKIVTDIVPELELDDLPDMEEMMISESNEDELDLEEDQTDDVITSIEESSHIQSVEEEVDAWHSELNNE